MGSKIKRTLTQRFRKRRACKDISNAGLLGTISIMAENSGTGAIIDVREIPCPNSMGMRDWVKCFQSYGFILSSDPSKTEQVIQIFRERGVDASVVGNMTEGAQVWLSSGQHEELLFDFEREYITGIRAP